MDELAEASIDEELLMAMNQSHRYAALATLEAWTDAGLEVPDRAGDEVDWDTGTIFGTGIGGMDIIAGKVVPLTDAGKLHVCRQLIKPCFALIVPVESADFGLE